MRDAQSAVEQFHGAMGATSGTGRPPQMRDGDLRISLIGEECDETINAIDQGDFPGAVDGLADLIYVCLGAAVAWGVDLEPVFELVHAANMAKAGGPRRADGKILKPDGWTPPDVAGELRRQGWQGGNDE